MKVSGKNRHPRHLFLVRFLLHFYCLSHIFSCTYAALIPGRNFQAASHLTTSSDAVSQFLSLTGLKPFSHMSHQPCIQEHGLCSPPFVPQLHTALTRPEFCKGVQVSKVMRRMGVPEYFQQLSFTLESPALRP